jgi:hypothetical protein
MKSHVSSQCSTVEPNSWYTTGMSKRQPSVLSSLFVLFVANAYLADLAGVDVLRSLGVLYRRSRPLATPPRTTLLVL